ncbi:RNA-directed RNA polymerase 2 [Phlebopus sp. FC_14]|nr:RNA-directed RNA polymerase 2 [Phlebopus sp. FC_14]
MDISMKNIDPSVSRKLILLEIAKVLEQPRFARISPALRFDVDLFRDRRTGHGLSGEGLLILPTVALGDLFLRACGGSQPDIPITVASKSIHFEKSDTPVREAVLHQVRKMRPLRIIELQVEEEITTSPISNDISFQCLQVGWECRDHVFSIEWEDRNMIAGSVVFEQSRREVRLICIKQGDPSDRSFRIVTRFSNISWLALSPSNSTELSALLFLHSPPSFDTNDQSNPLRKRLSALPYNDHRRVVSYTSNALRLTGLTGDGLARLGIQADRSRIHCGLDHQHRTERRDFFSEAVFRTFHQWTESLDWGVAFQVESLVRGLLLAMKEMLCLQPLIERTIMNNGPTFTASALRHLAASVRNMNSSRTQGSIDEILRCFDEICISLEQQSPVSTTRAIVSCYHATVTPTAIRLLGPFPERSNRVLRSYPQYHNHFLRVTFSDENGPYRFDREIDGRDFIRRRVGRFLRVGLSVAGRKFDFLAYSQSSLKEHSVWFSRPFEDETHGFVNAQSIIRSIGTFDNLAHDPDLMYCPARYGARISLAFTATEGTKSAKAENINFITDILSDDKKFCFTDGVGTISPDLARAIWQDIRPGARNAKRSKLYPRAYQIRFMGSKGMVSVDTRLRGRVICLRPSMIKFEAPETRQLEIARAFDKPGNFYLNRPLIMLLEGMGVRYETFEKYQRIMVQDIRNMAENFDHTAYFLEVHGLGQPFRLSSVLGSIRKLGITGIQDPFFVQMLEFAVHHILRELKHRARIHVPGAYTLVGVADIYGLLREGEISVCIRHPDNSTGRFLEGPVLITRSPTIHPGDVQVVHAVGKPPLKSPYATDPLYNTVIFATQGSRPLPSYLGGGDLDGDEYHLIPLLDVPEFTPQKKYPPAAYKPAPRKTLDRPSTMEDVGEFFMEYITSDIIGLIAQSWLLTADQSPHGIFDPRCTILASLHSDAVDYPKSGTPVALGEIPKLKHSRKPDWDIPETQDPSNNRCYKSDRAVGRLFREINLSELQKISVPTTSRSGVDASFDNPLCEALKARVSAFIPTEKHKRMHNIVALRVFQRYMLELETICASHTLSHGRDASLTEEEVTIGTINAKASHHRFRGQVIARMKEQTFYLVESISEELLSYASSNPVDILRLCWTTWKLTLIRSDLFGAKSMGWILLGMIFDVIKELEGNSCTHV